MEGQPLMASGQKPMNRIRDMEEGHVHEEVPRPGTEAKPAEQSTKAEQTGPEPTRVKQTGLDSHWETGQTCGLTLDSWGEMGETDLRSTPVPRWLLSGLHANYCNQTQVFLILHLTHLLTAVS